MIATAKFIAKMAELTEAFTRRTADDADEFEALGNALSVSGATADRARLQYLAHRLAGGAATFGLMGLEEPAIDLENRILAHASATEICALSLDMAKAIRGLCNPRAQSAEYTDGDA